MEAKMKRRLRAVVVAATLVTVLTAVSPAQEVVDASPSFRVEESHLDLGTVVAGAVATATFVFHNDGPEDVRIIRAKPS
jgi:hypothetical protein